MSITPWSFSKIKSFEQCPKKFYHLKVAKDYKEPQHPSATYGEEYHTAAEFYVRDGSALPKKFEFSKGVLDSLIAKDGIKLCEYEMGLTEDLEPCGFKDENVWYRGIADLIILDEEKKLAWVIDYKTSKSAKYADKGQLELMALCVFKHFPEVDTVRAGLLFVVCNAFVKDKYTRDQEADLWQKWFKDYGRMQTTFNKDVWNAHPSGLCKAHCVVLECPHNGRN